MSAYIFLVSDTPLEETGTDEACSFSVFRTNTFPELSTDKPYFAELDIYESGCEAAIAEYLKAQLKTISEIEVWHTWLDGDFNHKIRKVEIPLDSLTPEDIQELVDLEVYQEPVTDYCYRILQTS